MLPAGTPLRAALYIDFDNVYSSLAAIDEWAAWSFGSEPARWLSWLEAGAGGSPRRLLVRRCYLNPAGWAEPEHGGAAWPPGCSSRGSISAASAPPWSAPASRWWTARASPGSRTAPTWRWRWISSTR